MAHAPSDALLTRILAQSKEGAAHVEADLQKQIAHVETWLAKYDPDAWQLDAHQPAASNLLVQLATGGRVASAAEDPEDPAASYQLHMNVERIRVPEVLFQPHLVGCPSAGAVDLLQACLAPYDADTQALLAQVRARSVPAVRHLTGARRTSLYVVAMPSMPACWRAWMPRCACCAPMGAPIGCAALPIRSWTRGTGPRVLRPEASLRGCARHSMTRRATIGSSAPLPRPFLSRPCNKAACRPKTPPLPYLLTRSAALPNIVIGQSSERAI